MLSVGIPSNKEQQQANCTNKQTEKKKTRTNEFNEVRQLPTPLGQKGRDIIINQLQDTINRGNTSLYIATESMKIRKQTTLNLNQKRTLNSI